MPDDSKETRDGNDPTKQRVKQEAAVLVDFTRALQRRVEKIRSDIGSGNGKMEIGLSEKEAKVINHIMRQGNMEGLIAGVATFAFLRRFPKYLHRRAAQRAAQNQYKLDHPGGKVNSPFQNATPANIPEQPKAGFIWRAFGFTVDLTLSAMVGLNVTAYMMDRPKMKKAISDLPLIEGRSALSDHFCGVLVEEYKRQLNYDPNATHGEVKENENAEIKEIKPKGSTLPPFDRKDILRNPHSETLQGILEFTKNCKKRQAMERRIRQERGMGPNEPVEIPSPGVISSEYASDGADDDDSFGSGDNYGGEKFLGDDGWSKDEVSSFVSDQEDSKK